LPDKKVILEATDSFSRLDLFIRESLNEMSRSQIEKLIKNQQVTLNGNVIVKKNQSIFPGDRIEITIHQQEKEIYRPSTTLDKLYEDDHIIIINKPTGFSVHPGAGEKTETILDLLLFEYPDLKNIPDTDRPGIVHRLDKETTGVLIIAKTLQAQRRLQKAFKRREVKKTYQALVKGKVRFRIGTINKSLMRNPRHRTKFMVDQTLVNQHAREAITQYRVVSSSSQYSWLKIFPKTGRTHQIRVHMAGIGHPVLGDRLYGDIHSFERLALHAYGIEFQHPVSGLTICCSTPLPRSFTRFIVQQFFLNPNTSHS